MSNYSKKGLALLLTILLILVIVPGITNALNDDVQQPDRQINLTKSATPASGSSVSRGDTITYTLNYDITNTYGTSNLHISDNIPANTTLVAGSITNGGTESGGTITWNIVDPPDTGSVSFSVKVDSNVAGGTVINNVGTANGDFDDIGELNATSNQTTHTVNVPTPVAVEQVVQPAAEAPQVIKPAGTEEPASTEVEATEAPTTFPATGLPEVSNLWLALLGLLSLFGAKLKS